MKIVWVADFDICDRGCRAARWRHGVPRSGVALLVLRHAPTPALLYFMVAAQGVLGYGLTSVIGAIAVEIFQGRHYGAIMGTLMLAAVGGGAVGPWAAPC